MLRQIQAHTKESLLGHPTYTFKVPNCPIELNPDENGYVALVQVDGDPGWEGIYRGKRSGILLKMTSHVPEYTFPLTIRTIYTFEMLDSADDDLEDLYDA